MVAVIADVVELSRDMESLSSKIIGPFARLQIVGPDTEAKAITKDVDAELSVTLALTVFDPDSFVICIFCIIAFALVGAVYKVTASVVLGS
jgi:hypothetical protein